MENIQTVNPDINFITSHWSPILSVRQKQYDDYNSNQNKDIAMIFYNSEFINPQNISRYLTNIPLVATNGDQYVILPNGENISPLTEEKTIRYNLLNPIERRLARRMIIISYSNIFAYGGYRSKTVEYNPSKFGIIISMAAPQFEFNKLEHQDFIVEHGDPQKESLFPSIYPLGVKPSYEEASRDNRNINLSNGRAFFLSDAYYKTMIQDISLILMSFQTALQNINNNGWLKLTAIGMGVFAESPKYGNLRYILEPLFISAAQYVINNWSRAFPNVQVIEFPNFSGSYIAPQVNFHGQVITTNREGALIIDERHKNYIVGIVNPSDVFSYKGNEFTYGSVEAEIGNNTDIRYRQVAVFNPNLLNINRYYPINLPQILS